MAEAPAATHAPDAAEAAEETRLDQADKLTSLTEAKAEKHEIEPTAFGLAPGAWVALAMAILIVVMLVKRVPALVTGILDGQIADIKKQLDEAKALRAEAEALRKEYADKIADAEKDAAAMLEHAHHEATAIVARAESDTTDVIARREKMAADRIEAAERAAIAELQGRAATAATGAARQLIAGQLGPERDKALVDAAIGDLSRL